MKLESTITCPECGYAKAETMPTDVCQLYYRCNSCGRILTPKEGDDCIYCSWGSIECPSKQEESAVED